MATTEPVSFEVDGGILHGLRLGTGPRVVLAAHGITASAMAWPAVAAALPDEWTLVAVDLRGRGRSRDLPPSTGLHTHAADLHRVTQQLRASVGGGPPVLAGHSMGAYVVVHAAYQRPDLYSRVVLVDGGVALPLPAGADPDEVLAATLGPALERLGTTYPSVEAYVDFFRAHPALGPHWDHTVEAYVRYDALLAGDGVRSRSQLESVRADGRDLLVSGGDFDTELRAIDVPVHLLTAPAGMFGEPPGLLPEPAVAAYDGAEGITVETVPGVNHYTILFDPAGAARVAAAIGYGA